MNLRVALCWLHADITAAAAVSGLRVTVRGIDVFLDSDTIDIWLDGRDGELVADAVKSRMDVLIAGGGEVG